MSNRNFRDYVVILTILRTGLRTNELSALLVSDIGADREIFTNLKVRAEIARCEELRATAKQTNLKAREIPIPNDLREQFKAFLNWKRQGTQHCIFNPSNSGWAFLVRH